MKAPAQQKRRRPERRTSISVDEVVALWRGIERNRREIDELYAVFDDWLAGSPQLAKEWNAFTRSGGISADDFLRFLSGQFRPRYRVRQRKHLRLIPGNEPAARRWRNRNKPDAA